MNMQGAIAALASLNHSQAAAAVANTGTAQAASNAQADQGFGTLLQMLMGNTAVDGQTPYLDAAKSLTSQEDLGELGAQLLQMMQLIESDPNIQSLVMSGDKAGLSLALNDQGIDLEGLDLELGELFNTDSIALIGQLMPEADNTQLMQNLSELFGETKQSSELGLETRLSAANAANNNIVVDTKVTEEIDPRLQELIAQKIGGLKQNLDSATSANDVAANTMVTDASNLSTKIDSSAQGNADNLMSASPLLLSQQGMELRQKLNSKNNSVSVSGQEPKVQAKPLAFSESDLTKGLFSEGIKSLTENVISKVSSAANPVTANIDLGLDQNPDLANQLHFNVKESVSLGELETNSTVAKSQFSVISNTVDQVQGLAKDMAMQIRAGNNEIRIAIKPEHLGEMLVKVSVESDSINLDMKVENAEVKQVFDASLTQLRESLSQNGIKISNLNVDIQQHDMSEQSRSRFFQGSKNSKKSALEEIESDANERELTVDRNVELQSRVYAHAAYGVNHLA